MKIKFAELSFQNTLIIHNFLEFLYQKSVNLYDIKFSNDILNLKFYQRLHLTTRLLTKL